jgi:non-specific serine/threonine protein kinase
MNEDDPRDTQRYVVPAVAAELEAAGFGDAEEIGRGGFGVVYRCTQPDLDRTVAVKVLTTDLGEEDRARFFREQRAMGRLSGHPNIVNVLQVGATERSNPYLVMQYHPHGSLEMRIRRHGHLALADVLRLGVKMAGAMETAHRLGILHRDVKPANILITDYGEPALADFGIAHIDGGFETGTGIVTGSPAFTAPEVLKGDPPSPASDIYGLGATLFSALTGHAAFERRSGEQVVAQFLRITTQTVPDLRERGAPDDVAAVIERAMSGSPQDRPSATQLGDELCEVQRRHGFSIDEMALPAEPGAPRREALARSAVDPVEGAELAQYSSAAHAVRGAKGNLPLELTSFVGRRTEASDVKQMLSASHLVTLTGVGGVGKTRLARRVGESVQRAYGDGVWLVELGELSDESLLTGVVAAALGLPDHSARPLREALVEFLATRELLLLLDNCEQVVNATAELVETLLQTSPGLRILATSREPLGIGGEATLRVPPLTVPDPDREPSLRGLPRYDAISLFVDRAAAAVPTFELTEENKGTVARICHRLDALPLPIELAAARLRVMSPEQILQRLTDRYALLTRGSRDAPARQQTLRLCVDWSFELCTQQEQQAWARLSVFAGSFELDAAEQVCGVGVAPAELLDIVASLVEKSILIREESGATVRFRLLETLREYGREKLQQSDEYLELRRRHRDWCERLALAAKAEWISSRQQDWIARLRREQPNLRDALEFCVSDSPDTGLRIAAALFPFWNSRAMFSEGRHWLDRLLAHQSTEPTVERARALCTGSVLAGVQGDLVAGAALLDEARTLYEQTVDPMMHAIIARAEGSLALHSGDLPRACACFESVLASFDREDEAARIGVLQLLGRAYGQLGQLQREIGCCQQILTVTETRGEVVYRSYALRAMGVAVWRQGDRGRAARLLEQSLQLTRIGGGFLTAAACLEALAWTVEARPDMKRAAVLMGAAEELARSMGGFTVLFPELQVDHEKCGRKVRQALGERAFEAALVEGRSLDFDAAIAYALREHARDKPLPSAVIALKLTKRERQVAVLVAEGLTNRAIAARLVISPRTAQGHVEHLLTKLGFTSRTQIAAWVADQATRDRA